jgi:SAM-dependent methyltransferase
VNAIAVKGEMTANLRIFLGSFLGALLAIPITWQMVRQCRKPSGYPGRWILRRMNQAHAQLTAWGLEHIRINRNDAVLEVGCGGGRTVQTIARLADLGTVNGVDYSSASVAASKVLNREAIASGKVVIQNAAVSRLPFPNDSFDLVTAIETHYYWPDLPGDLQEIRRVLKPGGALLIVAEMYKAEGSSPVSHLAMKALGAALLSSSGHRDLFVAAGYTDVQLFTDRVKGWIGATGRKPQLFE